MIIVNYHNVLAHRPSAFNMLVRREWLLVDEFEKEIAWLAERYQIIPLADIVRAVQEASELPNVCAITLDDGYLGAYLYAAPVLEQYNATATFFVITGLLNGDGAMEYHDRMEAIAWLTKEERVDLNDAGMGDVSLACDACKFNFVRRVNRFVKLLPVAERRRLEARIEKRLRVPEADVAAYLGHEAFRMVDWAQVEDLRQRGFAIGSHTRTHAALSRVEDTQLEEEVAGSYRDLAERLGADDLAFAYPYGEEEHLSVAATAAVERAGYRCGLTMLRGANKPSSDPYMLRRMTYRNVVKAKIGAR